MKYRSRAPRTAALVLLACTLVLSSVSTARSAERPAGGAAPADWSRLHPAAEARSAHTATLLTNGEILVVGGVSGGTVLATAELYDPTGGRWRSAAAMLRPRAGHTATPLRDGRVLVVGGFGAPDANATDTAELYDPATNAWTAAPASGAARSLHSATLLDDGTVLVVGGRGASGELASAQLFDPRANAWSVAGAMSTPRASHTATLLVDGRVLVAGGLDGSATASAELYDPATRRWTPAPSMAEARAQATATRLHDGRVLVTGGGTATAELFDPAAGTWSRAGALSVARRAHTATLLADGRVLVAGGATASSDPGAASELYDPSTNAWTPAGATADAVSSHSATLVSTGAVVMVGGQSADGVETANAERYGASGGSWTSIAPIRRRRSQHTLTTLADGRVLVAGGVDFSDTGEPDDLLDAEIYDPVANTWTTTSAMPVPRVSASTILLADGRVLFIGDIDRTVLDADTLVYDPASNTWTAYAMPGGSHVYGTPVALGDGRVLVAGGETPQNTTRADAAVFDPKTNVWTAVAPMPQPRELCAVTSLADGRALVVGGTAIGSNVPPDGLIYDPATDRWTETGTYVDGYDHRFHTATLLSDGRVVVVGGSVVVGTDAFHPLSEARLFDPATSAWSTTSAPAFGRSVHAARALPSGRVLVAGGVDETGAAAATPELYDPATETWETLPEMISQRTSELPTPSAMLHDGRVLFAGNYASSVLTRAAEVFAEAETATPASRPVVSLVDLDQPLGGRVIVAGTGFDAPVLELRSVASGRVARLDVDRISGSSPTSFTSAPLGGFPEGFATLTVVSDGARSAPRFVRVTRGVPCAYTLTPDGATIPADGGTGSVFVSTDSDCVWAATSASPFLALVSPTEGTASGTVSFAMSANEGAERTATIAVAGKTVVVRQEAFALACTPAPRTLKPAKAAKGAIDASDCFEPGFGRHHADAYSLLAKPARVYTLKLRGDAVLDVDVVDPNGVVVASARGTVATLTVVTPTGGPYLVYVSADDPAATGAYKLKAKEKRAR